MNDLWITRKPTGADISFIYSTWLRSYHYDSFTKSTAKSIYFENYKLVLDHILKTAQVYVACSKEDPNVIFGYVVYEPETIHYVFVKEAFRRFGLAKALIKEALGGAEKAEATHRTGMVIPILRRYDKLVFNPFKLYQGVI